MFLISFPWLKSKSFVCQVMIDGNLISLFWKVNALQPWHFEQAEADHSLLLGGAATFITGCSSRAASLSSAQETPVALTPKLWRYRKCAPGSAAAASETTTDKGMCWVSVLRHQIPRCHTEPLCLANYFKNEPIRRAVTPYDQLNQFDDNCS